MARWESESFAVTAASAGASVALVRIGEHHAVWDGHGINHRPLDGIKFLGIPMPAENAASMVDRELRVLRSGC